MQHRFNKLATSSPAEFDYVIIGAGSAGSAIAYRLGEDRDISVALIEYGGSDAGPFIQMPAALSYPMNMRLYDWGYPEWPVAGLPARQGDRRLFFYQRDDICARSCRRL